MAVCYFCNHDSDHCDEYWKSARCFCKNFCGSIWIPTGCSRWVWRSSYEWNQTWICFRMKQVPGLLRVRQQQRNVISRFEAGTGSGARCICRYDRDLQLYSIYHAARTGRESCRTFRNGSSADGYGTSSWAVWRDFYCGNAVFIQFFDIPWHPVLCEKQCCIPFRR